MTQSDLEREFLTRWRQLAPDAPEPVTEYRFHPVRRFRFDFAWPDALVAVECEGGVWTRGRHTRGAGFVADCEKYNAATSLGCKLYRETADMLRADPAGVVAMVREALSR
jgi:very-short-patch-repair endonuclease